MKAIKALVVFMGLLIVVGLGVLGWGLMRQSSRPDLPPSPVAAPPTLVEDATPAFDTVFLAEPPGTTLQAVSLHGPTLILTLTGGGTADRVVLFHLPTAQIHGRIVVSE